MSFQVTAQHQAFFDWIRQGPAGSAAILEAVAGSGKTTTLRHAAQLIAELAAAERGCDPNEVVEALVVYLAFNTSAVDDVKARGLPRCVRALSLNSLGSRSLSHAMGRSVVDDRKTRTMLLRVMDLEGASDDKINGSFEFRGNFTAVKALVSKAKAMGLVPDGIDGTYGLLPDTKDSWDHLIDHFDLSPPQDQPAYWPKCIELARKVLVAGLQDLSVIDFDDQLYATMALRIPMPKFRWVMADEAQDISPVQRHMLHGARAPGGRLIAVGDPHQAIYGFRGADSDSLGAIGREFQAVRFPLSYTYRCPQRVVALAVPFVPHLRAADDAPQGEVVTGVVINTPGAKVPAISWRPDDLVVCRNTAPLVSLAYSLIRAKVPCKMLGREIGTGLLTLIKKLKARTVPDLLQRLAAHERKERDRLRRADMEAQIEVLVDRCETLRCFAVEAKGLVELEGSIRSMFDDDEKNRTRVTLSTIHRAKGSEAPRVVILDPWRMPSQAANQPWEMEQERNLAYVAVTRAKETLVFANLNRESKGPAAMPPPAAFGIIGPRAQVVDGVVVH